MSIEAYTVSYDRTNFHAPIPKGDETGVVYKQRRERIANNLSRYLGEYRLGVKFDELFYRKERNPFTGEDYLAASEPGPVLNVYRRAIDVKRKNGLSGKREVAECLGFAKLEKELLSSSSDQLFIWVSPPGLRLEGYGEYSFTFVGQKVKDPDTLEERIRVIPYRNIFSLEEHKAYLSRFDKNVENFQSDTQFLANPVVFSPTEEIRTPEEIIHFLGEREKISIEWFQKLVDRLDPLIQRYLYLVEINASDEELTKVKYAMENYTIAIKDELEGKIKVERLKESIVGRSDLERTIEIWGSNAPPVIGGSCGSTTASKTLEDFHKVANKSWEYHTGDCVVCGSKNVDVGPCKICKNCEKKFDEKENKM